MAVQGQLTPTVSVAPTHLSSHTLLHSHTSQSETYLWSQYQPHFYGWSSICNLMAMAHALERNRHTNSRHAYSHPEKDLPEPHPDTARQLVAQSHSHTHFRNGHVSKVPPQECPDYTAMYHSHGTSTAVIHRLPAVLSHHPRKTVSLPANTEVTQISIGPCIITAHVDRHTISHTQKHQHAISISHT